MKRTICTNTISDTRSMKDQLGLRLTDAARVNSASRSAMFGLPQRSFPRVLFSAVRLGYSNSKHLFDHGGIFGWSLTDLNSEISFS